MSNEKLEGVNVETKDWLSVKIDILVKFANYPLLYWWMNSSILEACNFAITLQQLSWIVSDISLIVINFGLLYSVLRQLPV